MSIFFRNDNLSHLLQPLDADAQKSLVGKLTIEVSNLHIKLKTQAQEYVSHQVISSKELPNINTLYKLTLSIARGMLAGTKEKVIRITLTLFGCSKPYWFYLKFENNGVETSTASCRNESFKGTLKDLTLNTEAVDPFTFPQMDFKEITFSPGSGFSAMPPKSRFYNLAPADLALFTGISYADYNNFFETFNADILAAVTQKAILFTHNRARRIVVMDGRTIEDIYPTFIFKSDSGYAFYCMSYPDGHTDFIKPHMVNLSVKIDLFFKSKGSSFNWLSFSRKYSEPTNCTEYSAADSDSLVSQYCSINGHNATEQISFLLERGFLTSTNATCIIV